MEKFILIDLNITLKTLLLIDDVKLTIDLQEISLNLVFFMYHNY